MEIRIKVEDNMAKAEEIKVVEKLHDAFKGTCSYLTDFFSEGTCNWIKAQIRDDFSCDIFPYIVEENADEIRSLTEERDKIVDEVGRMDKQIKDLRRRENLAKEKIIEKQEEIYNLEAKLSKQHNEIIQLKAELYDLIKNNMK